MAEELVEVYVAAGQIEASLIQGLFESNGIPAMSLQEGAGAAYGLTVGVLGEVKVLVPEEYVTRAREVLATIDDDGSAGPAESAAE